MQQTGSQYEEYERERPENERESLKTERKRGCRMGLIWGGFPDYEKLSNEGRQGSASRYDDK